MRVAAGAYFEGKAVAARKTLEGLLADPDAKPAAARTRVLRTLLDICLHSRADACVARYGPEFAAVAEGQPAASTEIRAEQAREAAYYVDAARLARGDTSGLLDQPLWKQENAFNGELYLRRQVLAANVLLAEGKPAEVTVAVDKILSLIASLKNPEAAHYTLAWALADTIAVLAQLEQTERALGLARSNGEFIVGALGERTADTANFVLSYALLLEQVGDLEQAQKLAALAVQTLEAIELEEEVRPGLLGRALSVQAALCAARGELDCARAALARHPIAPRFAQAGGRVTNYEELVYLSVRALASGLGLSPDPVAAEALRNAALRDSDPSVQRAVDVTRTAALALAQAPGPERQKALADLGRRFRDGWSGHKASAPGAWYRPGALDQLMLALALTQAGQPGADPDATFALFQLTARSGPSFDSDALTVLGQAKNEAERRAVHQALRLRARRDRTEREAVANVAAQAKARPSAPALLSHDHEGRRTLRDYAVRIAAAEAELSRIAPGGANLVPLKRLQAVLAPDEAALAVTPTAGGLAYLCVRRDAVIQTTGTVDLAKLALDSRFLQLALTRTDGPSENADSQFPAEAAVRVYDVLIRPFEGCLHPKDRIVWMSSVAAAPAPLAALLPRVPPAAGEGYDLAAADWLVKSHAVTYAGAASVVVASRSAARRGGGDFDFLGVGDPVMKGPPAAARFATLAPLPETKDELEASSRGFRTTRLLLQGEATERRLRGQLVGSYRYLSFATHGLVRDELPGITEPALVLTAASADDPNDDGLLTATEIADLNLSARFVALSACNTANFDLTQFSKDLPALSSAFAVAGVPATLATLWPVNSETGKRVVAEVFAGLHARPGEGASNALAAAQRAFLAAPPGRAYLHPRFWAPFVVLGDGAPAAPAQPHEAPALKAVEVLTRNGGEALEVARTDAGVAVRFIGDRDDQGRHSAALRMAGRGAAEAWRHESRGVGASRFLAPLGPHLVAAGYQLSGAGRYAPTLEAFDPATGSRVTAWRGDGLSPVDTPLVAAAVTGPGRAIMAAGEVNLRDPPDAGGGRVHLLAFEGGLEPRPLTRIDAPVGARLSRVAVAPLGADVLVAFSDDARPYPSPAWTDDWDQPLCAAGRTTWVQLRDGRTGEFKGQAELPDHIIVTALARPDGTVLLGGSVRAECGEARAVVVSMDRSLKPRRAWSDATLGASDVRGLAAIPGGGVLVAASKQTVVDSPRSQVAAFSGMVLTLHGDGRTSAPLMLDAGSWVTVDGANADDPKDVVLAGSVGGEAALFRLDVGPRARR